MFVDDTYAIYGFADLAVTQFLSISPNICFTIARKNGNILLAYLMHFFLPTLSEYETSDNDRKGGPKKIPDADTKHVFKNLHWKMHVL